MSMVFSSAVEEGALSEYRSATEAAGHSAFSRDPNPILTILRDFRGTIDAPATATSDRPTLSMAGRERNRLFRNDGNGTFTEVGYFEAADRIEDGYMAATLDYDLDGRQDLVLRHADPSPGADFPTLTLLRNTRAGGSAVTVYLEGSDSNRDGIGAVVTASVDGREVIREIRSVAGATQGEPAAYIGLGDASAADWSRSRGPRGRASGSRT